MLLVVSPAKKLDYDTPVDSTKATLPEYLDQSQILIDQLRQYSTAELSKLMHLSRNLAQLNVDRYAVWTQQIDEHNAKPCLLAFKGDVYAGMDAASFSQDDLDHAQQHLRILSGLYGLLRPLDLMMPYRLEMGTRLPNPRGANLYQFWGDRITQAINQQLRAQGDDVLINLASNEYFKSVRPAKVEGRIITPQFKDKKNGQYRMIGVLAKKARGLMSRFVLLNRLTEPQDLQAFDLDGYAFNPELSDQDQWVFTRG